MINSKTSEEYICINRHYPEFFNSRDIGSLNQLEHSIENYYSYINLEKQILKSGNIKNTKEFALIFSPMLDTLDYFEKRNCVHGNINPKNILLSEDLKKVVLIGVRDDADKKYFGASICSRETAAPEVLFENRITSLSDIYSLGCCMYFALTGKMLFNMETKKERKEKYIYGYKRIDEIKNELKEDELAKKFTLKSADICEMVKSFISDNEYDRLKINNDCILMGGIIRLLLAYYKISKL